MMKFKGTLSYSSQEMIKVFNTKTFGLVDPFYNDLFGAKKCFNNYRAQK